MDKRLPAFAGNRPAGLCINCFGDGMRNPNCDPLALTTTVNSLAVAIAGQLNERQLGLAAAILTQLGDTLGTIAARPGRRHGQSCA